MGGGMLWRGVSRLVTPATRVALSSTTSTSVCSFCKASAVLHAQAVGVHSCACPSGAVPKVSSSTSQHAALWEPDEWEFGEEEERVDRLVFGALPSRSEVEAASSEVQNALRLGLVAQAPDQSSSSEAFSSGMQSGISREFLLGNEDKQASKPSSAAQLALDWIEPPPVSEGEGTLQPVRRDNVAVAFHQFQNNLEVQSMVVSLASDPAVWEAVLANEKIQEFKRKLRMDKDVKTETVIVEKSPNFLARLHSFWQSKMSQLKDVLTNMINSLFNKDDSKALALEDGVEGADFVDKAVKSSFMVALVVLFVVILKRLAGQAA